MRARLRRHTVTLVLAAVAVVSALVCAIAARGAGPINPVSQWLGETDGHVVATKAQDAAAAIRAKPLMSDEWAGQQVEPERNASQGAWLDPASQGAYSRAQAVPAIGDTTRDVAEDKAIRAYKVTWRWASRDGEPAEGTRTRHVTIYLEKHSGAWEVVGHQSHELPAGEVAS